MDGFEYTLWKEAYRLQPFGDECVIAARQCAVTANAAGGKKGGGSFNEDDFLEVPRPKQIRKQSDEEVQGIVAAVIPKTKDKAKKKGK